MSGDYSVLLGERERFRPASPESWDEIESELQIGLPRDYKEFVDGYGDCILAGHLYIPHPEGEERLKSWIEEERSCLAGFFEFVDDVPEFIAENYSRLIPWGYHNWDGDICCFLPPVCGNDWIIVILVRQCPGVRVCRVSFYEFVAGLLSSKGVPRWWPPATTKWESVEWSPLI